MELYILRHGTTDWNKKHLLQGQTDIPLDSEGRELARETAEGMRKIHFDLCVSSPLLRAYETAEIVLAGRNMIIHRDPRLMEMNFGEFEGADCSPGDPDFDPRVAETLKFDLCHYACPPGGESMEHLLARTAEVFDEIAGNPAFEEKRILLSMHGASGRAMMHHVWGGGSFWAGGVPKNCTVCIVRTSRGKVTGWQKDVQFARREIADFYD